MAQRRNIAIINSRSTNFGLIDFKRMEHQIGREMQQTRENIQAEMRRVRKFRF